MFNARRRLAGATLVLATFMASLTGVLAATTQAATASGTAPHAHSQRASTDYYRCCCRRHHHHHCWWG